MQVRFTPTARTQFLEVVAHLIRERPSSARHFRNRVATALRRLQTHPASGRRLPEFPDLPHREVIVGPYRLFYRIDDDSVWVVAVWHGARLAERPPI